MYASVCGWVAEASPPPPSPFRLFNVQCDANCFGFAVKPRLWPSRCIDWGGGAYPSALLLQEFSGLLGALAIDFSVELESVGAG